MNSALGSNSLVDIAARGCAAALCRRAPRWTRGPRLCRARAPQLRVAAAAAECPGRPGGAYDLGRGAKEAARRTGPPAGWLAARFRQAGTAVVERACCMTWHSSHPAPRSLLARCVLLLRPPQAALRALSRCRKHAGGAAPAARARTACALHNRGLTPERPQVVLKVAMMCGGCKGAVTRVLEKMEGKASRQRSRSSSARGCSSLAPRGLAAADARAWLACTQNCWVTHLVAVTLHRRRELRNRLAAEQGDGARKRDARGGA